MCINSKLGINMKIIDMPEDIDDLMINKLDPNTICLSSIRFVSDRVSVTGFPEHAYSYGQLISIKLLSEYPYAWTQIYIPHINGNGNLDGEKYARCIYVRNFCDFAYGDNTLIPQLEKHWRVINPIEFMKCMK